MQQTVVEQELWQAPVRISSSKELYQNLAFHQLILQPGNFYTKLTQVTIVIRK